MIEALVTGTLLGLVAGLVPGPYTTVVASAALEHGFRAGARLALIPLVTDIPPMILTTLVLHQVNDELLTVVGMGGGALIVFLGVRIVQRQSARWQARHTGQDGLADSEGRRTFWAMAASGLLSPAPWVFWLGAAGPLLLRAWYRSWADGVVFAATLFVMLVGTAMGVAWAASRGGESMGLETRRRVLRVVGVGLGVIGVVMVWQSAIGNFQRMIRQQEEVREEIE